MNGTYTMDGRGECLPDWLVNVGYRPILLKNYLAKNRRA